MPADVRGSLQTAEGRQRLRRERLSLREELLLASLPTAIVLVVLGFVEALSQQRLLFASLASSAFLIYLDPQHGTNTVRSLVGAQLGAAVAGWVLYLLLGPGYWSAGVAMVITIVWMVTADVVHPPAVSTAMSFALRAGSEGNLIIFIFAVLITAVLVLLQRWALWFVTRTGRQVREQVREAAGTARRRVAGQRRLPGSGRERR